MIYISNVFRDVVKIKNVLSLLAKEKRKQNNIRGRIYFGPVCFEIKYKQSKDEL